MGTTIYRVTGIALSLTVGALGGAACFLLNYAGQDSVDAIYRRNTYIDEYDQFQRHLPENDWLVELLFKGWIFGYIFVVPGFNGMIASLFYKKCLMKIHVIVGVVLLIVGTFLHAGGGMAIIVFRVLTFEGVIRYETWPSDCNHYSYYDDNRLYVTSEKCKIGQRALYVAIAAVCVCFVAWIFLLCQLLFVAFTYHNIGKDHKGTHKEIYRSHKKERKLVETVGESPSSDNIDSNDPPQILTVTTQANLSPEAASTTIAEVTNGQSTLQDNFNIQDPHSDQSSSTSGAIQKSEDNGAKASDQGYVNKAYDVTDDTDEMDIGNTNAEKVSDNSEPKDMLLQ